MTVDLSNEWLIGAGQGATLTIWRIAPHGSCGMAHTLAHPTEIACAALSPEDEEGKHVATACRDGSLRVWTLPAGELAVEMDGAHGGAAGRDGAGPVAMSATDVFGLVWLDARTLLSAGTDRALRRWCARTGSCLQSLCGTAACSALAVDRALGLVASPQRDHAVALLACDTLDCARTLHGHTRPIMAVALGGGLVACAGMGGLITCWDAHSGACTRTLSYRAAGTYALALLGGDAGSGALLLSGGCGETCVRVWSLRHGALVARLHRPHGGSGSVCALAVHGARVLSGDNAASMPQLWEADDGYDLLLQCATPRLHVRSE